MTYSMHTVNLWHVVDQWFIRCSIRSLELSLSEMPQRVATWCTMSHDDGDDESFTNSTVTLSFTHFCVLIVVLMNMLICRITYTHNCRINPIAGARYYSCARRSMGCVASDTWRTTMRAILVPYMFASVKLTCTYLSFYIQQILQANQMAKDCQECSPLALVRRSIPCDRILR
jgi:hypothetical protein